MESYLQKRSLDAQVLHGVSAGQDFERISHFSDGFYFFIGLGAHLVQKQLVDIVGEEGTELALLPWTHAGLDLLNEPVGRRRLSKNLEHLTDRKSIFKHIDFDCSLKSP